MNKKHFIPMIATALAVTPFATASAQEFSGVRIDSSLNFTLRITAEGEESERNGVFTSRFSASRMGPREVLAALENVRMVPGVEGGEGGAGEGFPRGSRLVATPDRGVWVVDRQGFPIFDASPYVRVFVSGKGSVRSGTFNDNNGDQQSSSLGYTGLNIDLPTGMIAMMVETAEPDGGNVTDVSGQGLERYSRRSNSRGIFETLSVSGRLAGTGRRFGNTVMAEGTINLQGREFSDER